MKKLSSLFLRVGSFALIIGIFVYCMSENGTSISGELDLKAALLVFLTPLLVLFVFHKDTVQWGFVTSRLFQGDDRKKILEDLNAVTDAVEKGGAVPVIVSLSENHSDPFLRYCGELYTGKIGREEFQSLVVRRIDQEDANWQAVNTHFGFLAKLAPYFGMLATVVGMIHLLKNMNDFSHISGSMALALQGTLFGLISFTLLYCPLQKLAGGFREICHHRNTIIAQYFSLLLGRAEVISLRECLKVHGSLSAGSNQKARK